MMSDLEKTTVSKDYVDNIIQSMLNTLLVLTPGGKIQTVNGAACTLLGYNEAELKPEHTKERQLAEHSGHSEQNAGPDPILRNFEDVGQEEPIYSPFRSGGYERYRDVLRFFIFKAIGPAPIATQKRCCLAQCGTFSECLR